MSKTIIDPAALTELPLGDQLPDRSILDQLLIDSKLYRDSREFQELLDFIVRLRNMAPFNAMLLQIQKPGLNFAATAKEWQERFHRNIKEKARPLLIMWPFGPVSLVYDVIDTEGDEELPKDVASYYASGPVDENRISRFIEMLGQNNIATEYYDQGDGDAGFIRRLNRASNANDYSDYQLGINRNHEAPMKFVTLAHELGHLFLGHLSDDKKLGIPDRQNLGHRMEEIEAESVAYLVSHRNGVESRSQKYLHSYVEAGESAGDLNLYAITRAAGHIERLLGLS